jgi:hypothetical protein
MGRVWHDLSRELVVPASVRSMNQVTARAAGPVTIATI